MINNVKWFVINRNTGLSMRLNKSFEGEMPPHTFFINNKFAKIGHIVELIKISENTKEYFGVEFRKDSIDFVQKGKIGIFRIENLKK